MTSKKRSSDSFSGPVPAPPVPPRVDVTGLKRFLLFPATGIGDTIQFTPVVKNLKKLFPGAEITVVTGSSVSKDVFTGSPYVSRVYVLEKRSLSAWMSFLMKLRLEAGSFDAILAAVGIPSFIPLFLGPRLVVAFNDRSRGGTKGKTEWVTLARNLSLNEVQECLRLLRPLGLESYDDETDLFMSDDDKRFASSIWRESNLEDRYPVFTVHTRCDTMEKQWKQTHFAKLIRSLIEFYPHSAAILVGGPGEDVRSIVNLVGDRTRLVDLTGRTTLLETSAVVQRSHLLISNDSAVTHAAASVNTPVVVLFGPTDPRRVKPWNPKGIVRVLASDIGCRPCYLIYSGSVYCRYGDEDIRCMDAITPGMVIREVKTMIDITGAPILQPAATDTPTDTI